MRTILCNEYIQKLIMTKANVDSEYLGADIELSQEILDFFALKLGAKSCQQFCPPDNEGIHLDEYELAMAG